MHRSELTIDLGALRRNVRTLLRALDGAALWAVVKADGYGHGAVDVGGGALRDRALRPLAVRRGCGAGRARARVALGEPPRPGQAARAGPEHGLRATLRRGATDLDRPRPGRLRGRISPLAHGRGRSRRRRV